MAAPIPPVPPVVAVPVSTSGPMSPPARYLIALLLYGIAAVFVYGVIINKDTVTWPVITGILVPLVLGTGAAVPATLSFVVTLARPFVPQVKFGRGGDDK